MSAWNDRTFQESVWQLFGRKIHIFHIQSLINDIN